MKKLLDTWALPNRNAEKIAVSLRLPFDIYAKLHALKEVYPSQTVTDIATDILREGLESVIQSLPDYEHMTRVECFEKEGEYQMSGDQIFQMEMQTPDSPRKRFNYAYSRIFAEKNAQTETTDEAAK